MEESRVRNDGAVVEPSSGNANHLRGYLCSINYFLLRSGSGYYCFNLDGADLWCGGCRRLSSVGGMVFTASPWLNKRSPSVRPGIIVIPLRPKLENQSSPHTEISGSICKKSRRKYPANGYKIRAERYKPSTSCDEALDEIFLPMKIDLHVMFFGLSDFPPQIF